MDMYIQIIMLATLVLVSYVVSFFLILPIVRKFIEATPTKTDDLFLKRPVVTRTLHLLPCLALFSALPYVDKIDSFYLDLLSRGVSILIILNVYAIVCALLDVFEDLSSLNEKMQNRPLHGVFQAVKLSLFCVSLILVVSLVTGKSAVLILSALGAAATVLMLIFRDSILGVVSGLQINLSDLLRKGDWIEIERHQTDGTVLDITLTSIKVKNWDNTISVIPAYDLITNSFKNWRGMLDSKGRRIKRSLLIDLKSVHFLSSEEMEHLSHIKIIEPYLKQNNNVGEEGKVVQLTNIGAFRAYCNAYLKSNSKLRSDMTMMTRQRQPTPQGLPLEIYAFTRTTDWVPYENIQSDIFDHLIAFIPEFGLKLYQYPSYGERVSSADY
ncbi:MAG: mechanosensitive ion channel family protein [Fibrobacteraceae bacterium]|nr:mechanosensitive ion channel family protein [Fibrobacteraceae bacterium]